MTAGITRGLVFAGLVLAVVAVALTIQNLGAVIVSAVVAAIVAILVHRSLSAAPAPTPEPAGPSEPDWIDHLRALARLNAQIREHALASPIVERLEHCIDSLRRLLPELNEDHVGSELTWTVNRMATDYLARIVTPFVALAPSARGEHEPELLRSLEGVDAELDNIAELLHNARVGEFKTKAAFLRARFLDADLG